MVARFPAVALSFDDSLNMLADLINQIDYNTPRNLIDGGDFTTNPWQRGTSFTAIANTLTYTADRWFAVGGASSSISVSKQANTAIAGFGQALQWGRANANSNTAVINLGQVVETADSIRVQGQQVTLSFWAQAGANGPTQAVSVKLVAGTGTDQSAANLVAGSWTGATNVINSTFIPTTTMTQYTFTGTVPANATQLGLLISYTPVGTAGANEWVQFVGVQLEAGQYVSNFEHLDVQMVLEICQRYFFNIAEPAAGVVVGAGMVTTTNNEIVMLNLPVQMRAAPTVTVTSGSWKLNIAGTATAAAGFAAGTTHTPNYISVVSTTTATSGQATLLQGGGGAGVIQASADY